MPNPLRILYSNYVGDEHHSGFTILARFRVPPDQEGDGRPCRCVPRYGHCWPCSADDGPHDPGACREHPDIENPDRPNMPLPPITKTVSPGTVDLFDRCPGDFKYSTGDYKLH
jgi:hypothetical protein